MPATTAAAAVARAWLDWAAPAVISVVGALGEGIADQELELADLVAAEGEAGQIVPLDQDARTLRRVHRERPGGVEPPEVASAGWRGETGAIGQRSSDTIDLLLFNWIETKDLSRYLNMSQMQPGVLQRVQQGVPLRERIVPSQKEKEAVGRVQGRSICSAVRTRTCSVICSIRLSRLASNSALVPIALNSESRSR